MYLEVPILGIHQSYMFYKSDSLCPFYLTLYATLIIGCIFITYFQETKQSPKSLSLFFPYKPLFSVEFADTIKLKKNMTSVL